MKAEIRKVTLNIDDETLSGYASELQDKQINDNTEFFETLNERYNLELIYKTGYKALIESGAKGLSEYEKFKEEMIEIGLLNHAFVATETMDELRDKYRDPLISMIQSQGTGELISSVDIENADTMEASELSAIINNLIKGAIDCSGDCNNCDKENEHVK